MRYVIFDVETNGIQNFSSLSDLDRIHCVVAQEVVPLNHVQNTGIDPRTGHMTGEDAGVQFHPEGPVRVYRGDSRKELDECEEFIQSADVIIGHNLIGFDVPVGSRARNKCRFYRKDREAMLDTLVMSRLAFPHLADLDYRRKDFDKKFIGSHSMKAWGLRLGNNKTEYCGGFDELSEEMIEYCKQDVAVNIDILNHLCKEHPWLMERRGQHGLVVPAPCLRTELEFAFVCRLQEMNGIGFDESRAQDLAMFLEKRRSQIKNDLVKKFSPIDEIVMKTKTKPVEFNPNSRQHLAKALQGLGWKPQDFTPNGQPKVDETVLSGLTQYPEAKAMAEFLMLSKRLGQLSYGREAWLSLLEEKDGTHRRTIHGGVNTLGTITGRCSHRRPNVAQVPSVSSPFGYECRSLFIPRWKSMRMVGCDASGLELRCLAHYLHPYDDGKYTNLIKKGDIHTANQEAAGLETRNQAKTFIYALIYGAGPAKMGTIVGGGAREGKVLMNQFYKNMPALKMLQTRVQKAYRTRGYLLGLDGRRLQVRSAHSALNTLLQGAGAIIMKNFTNLVHKEARIFKVPDESRMIHYNQLAHIHDEVQYECSEKDVDHLQKIIYRSFANSAKIPGLKTESGKLHCPIVGEVRVGDNWAETH